MPSVIRTNIRHVLQGPLIAMFPLHSSLDVISLSWLCYYHCLHISIPPFPCPPPKPACKPYSIIFPRLCPVTPSHHIHLHIVQHLTFSYLGWISHDVMFSICDIRWIYVSFRHICYFYVRRIRQHDACSCSANITRWKANCTEMGLWRTIWT